MDKSEEYIEMSDKSGLEECCSYAIPPFLEKVKYIGDNVFVELDQGSTTWRTVRLLRQSQIQEMMGGIPANNIGRLADWLEESQNWYDVCNSMEQLWLAFYMHEKHQKIWSTKENKWIKE